MPQKQDSHNEQYKLYILKKDKMRKYREIMRSVFIFSSETKDIMAERLYITETDQPDKDRKCESTVLSGKILTMIRNLFNVETKQKITEGTYICCPIPNRISGRKKRIYPEHLNFFRIYGCLGHNSEIMMKTILAVANRALRNGNTPFSIKDIVDSYETIDSNDSDTSCYSTVRRQIKILQDNGLLTTGRKFTLQTGNSLTRLLGSVNQNVWDFISFFTVCSPVGLPGFYIGNLINVFHGCEFSDDNITYKFCYPVLALNQEIKYKILYCIGNRLNAEIYFFKEESSGNSRKQRLRTKCQPLKILFRQLVGREYLLASNLESNTFIAIRLDNIIEITCLEESLPALFDDNVSRLKHVNVNGSRISKKPDNVRIIFIIRPDEHYVLKRLQRQSHPDDLITCIDNSQHLYEYKTQISDENELQSWLKTFMGRIIKIESDKNQLGSQFQNDLNQMLEMYDLT